MRKYKYITFSDRQKIAAWYQNGDRPADIADGLGVTVKTVYLELKRGEQTDRNGNVVLDQNQRPAYSPVLAQQRIQASFKRRGKPAPEHLQGGSSGD